MNEIFIPNNNKELFDKLKDYNLKGNYKLTDNYIEWKINDKATLKIYTHYQFEEGYIDIKINSLSTHIHIAMDELYQTILDINNGVLIVKRSLFGITTIILSKEEYEKKKQKYRFLSYVINN